VQWREAAPHRTDRLLPDTKGFYLAERAGALGLGTLDNRSSFPLFASVSFVSPRTPVSVSISFSRALLLGRGGEVEDLEDLECQDLALVGRELQAQRRNLGEEVWCRAVQCTCCAGLAEHRWR
jgi:hypothetical protein